MRLQASRLSRPVRACVHVCWGWRAGRVREGESTSDFRASSVVHEEAGSECLGLESRTRQWRELGKRIEQGKGPVQDQSPGLGPD